MIKRIVITLLSVTLLHATAVVADPIAPEPATDAGRAAHAMLTRLCDDFGGRLTGGAANRGALEQLAGELRQLGLQPELVPFTMPGWERGADRVDLVAPLVRSLRVASLSYTQPHAAFEADVVDIGLGAEKEYPAGGVKGKIGLIGSGTALPLREIVRIAQARGLAGLLMINRENGGLLLARTGSFIGETLPLPVYTVSQEEGLWLQRLLARGRPVRVRMETQSHCRPTETANLVLRFPGKSPAKIIIGAHFDSWDLGQGALDNGLGTAQLFALAHFLRGRELAHSVELVWFNGEEQGLWGSRYQTKLLGDTPVVAMLNLDMVGVPLAVNALGEDALVPLLERWNTARGEHKLPLGVQNINWFGSDHTSYQLAGVRAITFHGPIDRESVRYYHDLGDTIDKLPEKVVVDSTVIIADLVLALANDPQWVAYRRSAAETKELFQKAGLEPRMRGLGWWPFETAP